MNSLIVEKIAIRDGVKLYLGWQNTVLYLVVHVLVRAKVMAETKAMVMKAKVMAEMKAMVMVAKVKRRRG